MLGVKVDIRRFVDDSQPGWVECVLTDAHGREWFFVEKVPVVSLELLDVNSDYPRPGVIACEVLEKRSCGNGKEVVRIDTERPWRVAATTGEMQFEVRLELLQELE